MTALRKDLIREIKNSKNRFLSIAILIALAVAFLSGLKATAPDMKNTGDEYLDKQQLMDIQVLSTLGLTKDDIKALGMQDNIERAVGAYCIDAWAGDLVAKAYSITDGMNLLTVTSGRMPESPDECIVDKNLLEKMKISVGDSITIYPSDDYEDCLTHKNFTIVGTAVSPYYISVERGSASIGSGNVRAYVYLPESAFDLDYYTVAYAKVKGAEELAAFTDEYDDYIDDVIDSLKDFGDRRAKLRYDDIIDEALEKIDDAQNELDDKEKEADEKLRGMGTTVSVIWLGGESVYVAHVGDSRVYRMQQGALRQITEDHSLVGEMVRAGAITREQASTHPMRNVITRALGTEGSVEVDLLTVPRRADDLWLICSDGLYDMVSNDRIAEILRSHPIEQAADMLLQAALDGGGSDNISLVLVKDREGAQ